MKNIKLFPLGLFAIAFLMISYSCSKTDILTETPAIESNEFTVENDDLGIFLPESKAELSEKEAQEYISSLSKTEVTKLRNDYITYKYLNDNDLLENTKLMVEGNSYSELNLENLIPDSDVRNLRSKFVTENSLHSRACYHVYRYCGTICCWWDVYCYAYTICF